MDIDSRKKFIKTELEKLRSSASLKGGRLSADSRIASLFDEGTFVENGAFVSESTSFANTFEKNAEGVVTGYGAVNGRLVFCCVQDYSRDCGALSMAGAGKIADVYTMAIRNAAPVITVFDCDGEKLADGIGAAAAVGKVLKVTAEAKGIVPQIAVITGVCSGGMAAVAESADIVIMGGKNASLSLAPASVLKNDGADAAVSSAEYAMKHGLAALAYGSEEEAFTSVRGLLDYLPSNYTQGEVGVMTNDAALRDSSAIEALLCQGSYKASDLVSVLVDDGKFVELCSDYGKEFAVGFASVDGFSCGVIAGNPECGRYITSDGASKAACFVDLCDSFSLPVITICDFDGYSSENETKSPELMQNIAALSQAYAEADVPLVTVIAGKATGSSFAMLGSKALGADMVFALPTAVISPMPTESAVEFMMNDKIAEGISKEELAEKWETELSSPVYAAKSGLVDFICESSELRARLAAALNMLGMKAEF